MDRHKIGKILQKIIPYIGIISIASTAWASPSERIGSNEQRGTPELARSALFHLDGVSEDVARGDLIDCMAAASGALSQYSRSAASGEYGLIGSLIGGLLGGAKTNRLRNASLQKCMVLRGYKLFLVDEPTWQATLKISDPLRLKPGKNQSVIVDALAAFASTPLPDNAAFQS